MVLASQNPVDLDYKGLANAGTWFIGRLQTERDKLRVLDGLEGAASELGAKFDRQSMERLLAGLTRRIFLVNNVHADKQEVIETRWSLSYLRGPLTKAQIRTLMSPFKENNSNAQETGDHAAGIRPTATVPSIDGKHAVAGTKPALPPGVPEYFFPSTASGALVYKPMILGAASIRFTDTKAKLDYNVQKVYLAEIKDEAIAINWSDAMQQRFTLEELETRAPSSGSFAVVPSAASKPRQYKLWTKEFSNWLVGNEKFYLLYCPELELYSAPNEPERQFRIRVNEHATQERDRVVQQLRARYQPRVQAWEDKVMRAEQQLERERDEVKQREMETAISIGATVLGAFAGRRSIGRGASTAARQAARAATQKQEIARAEETLAKYQEQSQQLQNECAKEAAAVRAKYAASTEKFETVACTAKKSNVSVSLLALVWMPYRRVADDTLVPAWQPTITR
jgi:hypothetical protein